MVDINQNVHDDCVLLHLAVIEENIDVVKFLLKHNVPVNCRAVNKQLSLEFVTDSEHQKHLESSFIDIVQDKSNHLKQDVTKTILAKTTTALHLATRNENKDITELLLQHGADVNSEMEGGETPLMIAVLSKRKSIVELLLDHGADVNTRTNWGKSALHYAAQTGQEFIVELILKRGGNVHATDLEGITSLHVAAEAGQKEVVIALLKNGANVDTKTKINVTALHYAIIMDHKEIVEILIDNGADINIIMKHGYVDLSPFNWVTIEEANKAWDLVSKYKTKMNFVNWYNTVIYRFYKPKEKNGFRGNQGTR